MKNVSGAAAILFHEIAAKIAANDGHPVFVKNPKVVELIDAGAVVETAPREKWIDRDGAEQMMAVVLIGGAK